jgi:regulator of protease activity HflC (stomatin/prohibitin superfamily)
MSVDQQFTAINNKLQLLLKALNRLQKENERLKYDLEQAKQKELAAKQSIDELQQQSSILKLASGEMSDKDKKNFEKKINQYIKEVDKCISFLSQ